MELNNYISEETAPLEMPLEKFVDAKVPAVTKAGTAAKDVLINDKTGVWVRIFIPEQDPDRQLPVMFYFHGGGFTMLSADSSFPDSFARYMCKSFQAMVVCVDYRKAPDHRYPTAYDDCHEAVRWVAESAALPDADLARCFLVGESAGGNIVHHVACRLAAESAVAGRRLKVLGNLVLAPFFGGEERTSAELRLLNVDPIFNYIQCDGLWMDYLPPGATRDHPAANVSGPLAPDLSGLPLAPFLVTVGEYDSLKDWQVRYVQALQRMGQHVELRFYKGGVHCFQGFPELKVSAQFRADFEHFVRSKLEASVCVK